MTENTQKRRKDVQILWVGIAASFLFTAAIWGLGPRLAAIQHLPDTGASWYYWQLPEQSMAARITAWSFYLVHQVAIWGLIYYAQRNKLRYTTGLHGVNYAALGVNGFFIILHMVQTHVWYDGLAQDVSIWSSQFSVVLLLVLVLLMETPRRGLFFGQKVPLGKRVTSFVKKYHGYVFSWAIIYTFWYHPTEATSGHLIGFFYTFLLMLQGSLFFTRAHLNRWWTFTQEGMVLLHGTLVAYMSTNVWPMFGFGFAGLIVITQMHGLGLSRAVRAGITAVYVVCALWVYNSRGWDKLDEIIRIPMIEYLSVFALAAIIWLGLWIAQVITRLVNPPKPIESTAQA
ncbi:MAG: hypothetical protein AAF639_25915 [Chloroflexota bacterium]